MKATLFIIAACAVSSSCFSQNRAYKDSAEAYFRKYIKDHEVVTGKDKAFMQFFPADEKFRIRCRFERTENSAWFKMETSGVIKKIYRVYGLIYFTIHDTALSLQVYQSQDLMQVEKYRDHLFIPFTDATSGEESYEGGRYIDLTLDDVKSGWYVIDFNKAYNPYCAYVSGKYNCPIPPKENHLPVAVRAGEKIFNNPH